MMLTLDISSSPECRLSLLSLKNSTLPELSSYELISFIIGGKHHVVSAAHFSLSQSIFIYIVMSGKYLCTILNQLCTLDKTLVAL